MLLLVLILVLIAFGLLVVALLTGSVLWAWVSVGVSVAAAAVLLIDWMMRRSAVRAGSEAMASGAGSGATTGSRSTDVEPVTEVLPVLPAGGLGGAAAATSRLSPHGATPPVAGSPADTGADATVNGVPQVAARPPFTQVPDGDSTVVMPVVRPSGSAGRPSGATPMATPPSEAQSPSVTETVAADRSPLRLTKAKSPVDTEADIDNPAGVDAEVDPTKSSADDSSAESAADRAPEADTSFGRDAGGAGDRVRLAAPSTGADTDDDFEPDREPETGPDDDEGVAAAESPSDGPQEAAAAGALAAGTGSTTAEPGEKFREDSTGRGPGAPVDSPVPDASPADPERAATAADAAAEPEAGPGAVAGGWSAVETAAAAPTRPADTVALTAPAEPEARASETPAAPGDGAADRTEPPVPPVVPPAGDQPFGRTIRSDEDPVSREAIDTDAVDREPVGTEPVERDPVGQDPVGQDGVGQDRVGQDRVGQEPVGQKPVGQEPLEQDRVGQDPVDREAVDQEPVDQRYDDAGSDDTGSDDADDADAGSVDNLFDPQALSGDEEPAEESAEPAVNRLVAGLDDEVVVIDERPRYHIADCQAVIAKPVIPLPVREAVELGFTPCAWCAPNRKLANQHPAPAR